MLAEFFDPSADQTLSTDRVLGLEAAYAMEVDQLQAASLVKNVDALRRLSWRRQC